jgi:hypothetical protein
LNRTDAPNLNEYATAEHALKYLAGADRIARKVLSSAEQEMTPAGPDTTCSHRRKRVDIVHGVV